MSIRKKLNTWEKAGLINTETVASILNYERSRKSNKFSKSLYGLGVFAILAGFLALIGANWQDIPASLKISVHLLLNIGAALSVFMAAQKQQTMRCDLSIVALMGFTLTFIALCGQVYHLNGSIADALLLWSILTTPFVIAYGRGLVCLFPWLVGVLVAIHTLAAKYVYEVVPEDVSKLVAFALAIWVPLIMIFASTIIKSKERFTLQGLLYIGGAFVLIVSASFACQIWYMDNFRFFNENWQYVGVLGVSAAALGFIYIIKTPIHLIDREDQKSLQLMLAASIAAIALPILLTDSIELTVLSAIAFIGYWMVIGFCAQKMDRSSLVSLAIVVIAIRIYIIYLELFGTLIMTGFGLIFSGAVLMGMAWGTRHIQKKVAVLNTNQQEAK